MAKNQIADYSTTASSNTDIGNISIAENATAVSALNNAIREQMKQLADFTGSGTIASGTTTDLSTVEETYINVTGTTTITGLGTVRAGIMKVLRFSGVLTLTHNGTSLILKNGASIVTQAGDIAVVVSEGSGNWRLISYDRAKGGWELIADDSVSGVASWAVTNLGAFAMLRLTFRATPATNGSSLRVRTSTNNGSSYDSGASDYTDGYMISYFDGAVSDFLSAVNGGVDAIYLSSNVSSDLSGSTVGNVSGEAVLTGLNEGINCFGNCTCMARDGTNGTPSLTVRGGARLSTTARNAIQVSFDSGNISIGRFVLEGLRG